ncbi:DUF993 family protein [Corynebacterium glyciniphilum]|uniref:DUF993 family protein n=1 Tax=Corynebacterium glyciniphilum TaxID=1404244 RepID=UPI003FD28996
MTFPVTVPSSDGTVRTIPLQEPAVLKTLNNSPTSREVYSAAHVVADPLISCRGEGNSIDWEATMQIRHRLWDLGLGIAESMDTAQRGMGLSPETALELGRRTVTEGQARGGKVVVGIATDSLPADCRDLSAIADAYIAQLQSIERTGGRVVMMASRQLAAAAQGPSDYIQVYDKVLNAAENPVILHWLGEMFDPSLEGYWGSNSISEAADTVLHVISTHQGTVEGIKISLLDQDFEESFRSRLPENVRLYTGDDYNYVDLIAGDGDSHSDALLGAFAAVPRFASAAFAALDHGDADEFRRILGPTQDLSRTVFEAPTPYYKVGVAWLAFLEGWQSHFKMIDGFETGRSIEHLGNLLEQAAALGLFTDPEQTASRANAYFRGLGVI